VRRKPWNGCAMRLGILGLASVLLLAPGLGGAEPTRVPVSKTPVVQFTKDRGVAARAKKVKDLLADPSAKVLALAKVDSRYAGARQAMTEAAGASSDSVRKQKLLEVAPTASAVRKDALGKARLNLADLESKVKAAYPMSMYVPKLTTNVGTYTPSLNSGAWTDQGCAGPNATGPLAFQATGAGDDTCVSERVMSAFYELDGAAPSRVEVTVEGSVSTNSTIVAFGVGGYSVVEVGVRIMATTQTPFGGQDTWVGEASCTGWMTGHAAASAGFTVEQKTTDQPVTLKCGVDIGTSNALWLFADIFNRATLITDTGSTANLSSNLKVNSVVFTTK
jgi:hypothetical protein